MLIHHFELRTRRRMVGDKVNSPALGPSDHQGRPPPAVVLCGASTGTEERCIYLNINNVYIIIIIVITINIMVIIIIIIYTCIYIYMAKA